MIDEKTRVRLKITPELLADMQRLGFDDDDIVAICTGSMTDDQAKRIAETLEAAEPGRTH